MTNELAAVEAERRAECAIDRITHESQQWRRVNRRPRAISAREALIALEFEALVVAVSAGNLANGVALGPEDFDRLMLAYQRIDAITAEAAR